MWKMLCYSSVR